MQGGNEATLGLYRVPLLLILTHETCRLNTQKQKNKIEKIENWQTWIQKFDLYLITTGIAEKSDKVKCTTFLHMAGDDAIKVFNAIDFDDDVDDFEVLKEKFREYCEPRKNITYLRHIFFPRAQGPYETIDAYVTDLKNKA